MKTKFLFFSILFLAFIATASAQNPYAGVDRSIGEGARMNKKKKGDAAAPDYADYFVKSLDKYLKLDDLQKIGVKNIFNDNKNSIEELSKSTLPTKEKEDLIYMITEKIDKEVLRILSKEQTKKFLESKEERAKKFLKS